MIFRKDDDVFESEFKSSPIIYFSKSRAGNFDDVLKVKAYLAKYDCEVTEFTGGFYSPDKLNASDLLVILPPVLEKYSYVGRGQYEEFFRALNDDTKINLPFIITSIKDGVPYGLLANRGQIIGNNWTTDYGEFFLLDQKFSSPLDVAFSLEHKDNFTNPIMEKDQSETDFVPELREEPKNATHEEVFNTLNLL